MNQAAFASLCDVSSAMISKYAQQGRIVFRGRSVNAAESLSALEGHLDEAKRQAAIAALAEMEAKAPPPLFDVIDGGRQRPPVAGDDLAEPVSWKARRDMYAAKEAELSYLERVGALVDASEIAEGIEAVIASFWSETEQNLKLEAVEIATDLSLDAEQARQLKATMIRQNRRLRENFARACEREAKAESSKSCDNSIA